MKGSIERLDRLSRSFEERPLDDLLRWALDAFAPRICLATSFGPQSIVLIHRISVLRPETTMFYVDTDLLFPETYALRDELSARLGLELTRVPSSLSLEQQAEHHGAKLWERDPDQCCRLRKVLPLRAFLADQDAWITGIRNGQSLHRSRLPIMHWDAANEAVKLNPLMRWSKRRVWEYLRRHDLPTNRLHERGFPSIGCQPCTRAVAPGEGSRSGRWSGFAKTECGIHHTDVVQLGASAGKPTP